MAVDCIEDNAATFVFDSTTLRNQQRVPQQFVWPDEEKALSCFNDLDVPAIDIGAFLSGDPTASETATTLIGDACRKHGFFLITNHGVDKQLIADAHKYTEDFFVLPLGEKQKAQRAVGHHCGYSSSFIGRFSSRLPWKETLSFGYSPQNNSKLIRDYVENTMGESYAKFGTLFQRYADEMNRLCMCILEILAVSLGVRRMHFKEFYEDNDSIFRLNYYPPCISPELTLGTGPHCDPTSLTILHQDQVGGLQVFVDGEWRLVRPNADAFVVNIGDTFMALTNGRYKSCLHRAAVNSEAARKSLTFFLSPNQENIVTPPSELVDHLHPRIYPDFTWAKLLKFTQKHYRADMHTLETFSKWLEHRRTE